MISLFKSNNPVVVIFYGLYLVLFRICFLLLDTTVSSVFNHTEPLSQIAFSFLKNISSNYLLLSLTLAALLTFVQALLINGLVNKNKVLPRKNYLPGAVYIIFVSFFKESLLLTPALLALTFLILATDRLFSLIKKEKSYGAIYDVGFLTCISSLFYFPAILFFLFAFFGLATVRPFSLREWMGSLLGYLSPLFVIFTYYFWIDEAGVLGLHLSNTVNSAVATGIIKPNPFTWYLVGCLVVVIAAFLLFLPSALYSSLIQVRKFTGILLFSIFVIAISGLLDWYLHGHTDLSHFSLLAMPAGIIASMVLVQIKRKAISEVIHIILVLLVLTMQYLPLFNLL